MAKKETTAAAALEIIVSRYGIDTFRDRRRAFALLTDLAPGDANTKDRRRIKQALDSGAAEILLKAAESGTGGELHINESVSRLMEQTDMAEEFAKQTIQMLANAFGVSAEDVSTDDGDDDGISIIGALRSGSRKAETSRRHSEGANIGKIIGIIAIALAAAGIVGGFIAGLLLLAPVPKQWLIAAGCGIALTAGTVGLSFAVENWTYNEKCQTITFAIPVLVAGNIVLCADFKDSFRFSCGGKHCKHCSDAHGKRRGIHSSERDFCGGERTARADVAGGLALAVKLESLAMGHRHRRRTCAERICCFFGVCA